MPVRPYDQEQQFLLPPAVNEWIDKDHPARSLTSPKKDRGRAR